MKKLQAKKCCVSITYEKQKTAELKKRKKNKKKKTKKRL